MEIQKIQTELKPIEKDIVETQEQIKQMVITSDEQYADATDLIKKINEKKKNIEKMRKFFVDPLKNQVKEINAMFKPQVEQADELVKETKNKMAVFFKKQEEARLKEEARLQAIRDKANEKRAEQGKEEIVEPVRKVEEIQKTKEAETAKATTKKVWKHKIISINKLPENVKEVIFAEAYKKGIIDTIIRKYIQAGERNIAGVEIYQDVEIAIR